MTLARPLRGWPNHAAAGEMPDQRLRRLCQGLAATDNWVGDGLEVDWNGKLSVTAGLSQAAGAQHPSMGYRTGTWYRSHLAATTPSTVALVPNRLYLVPLLVADHVEIDQIGAYCTAGAGGSSVRLGVYTRGRDGKPGLLLIDAGVVSTAAGGDKIRDCQRVLAPGGYWLAAVSDGAPTFHAVGPGGLSNELLGFAALADTQPSRCLYGAHTFGPLPSNAFNIGTVSVPDVDAPPALAVRILRELAPATGPGGGSSISHTLPPSVGAGTVSE